MRRKSVAVTYLAGALALGCGSDTDGYTFGAGGDPAVGSGGTSSGGVGAPASTSVGGSAAAVQGGMPGSSGGAASGGAFSSGGQQAGVGGGAPIGTGGLLIGAGGTAIGGAVTGGAVGSGGAGTGGLSTGGAVGASGGVATGGSVGATGGAATGGAVGDTGGSTGGQLGTGGILEETGGSAGAAPETGGSAGAGGMGAGGTGSECPASGNITYTLNQSDSPTDDELDAYERLTAAMDEALYYYNCYTDLEKQLWVNYNTGVPTAEANIDGWMSFGADRAYMVVPTAMHEIAHTLGIGFYNFSEMTDSNGIWTGAVANAVLASIPNPRDTQLHADSMHFWPYGLNYASEYENEDDLINHCLLVAAIREDMGL